MRYIYPSKVQGKTTQQRKKLEPGIPPAEVPVHIKTVGKTRHVFSS